MAPRAVPGLLVSLLALAGAACSSSKDGGPCGAGQVLCGGCYDPARYQDDASNCGGCGIACGAAGTCVNGQCACGGGTTRCDVLVPRCRDLQTDDGACGSCATACNVLEVGRTCQAGACGCFGDRTECGTVCTDTANDPNNCGAGVAGCGFACKTKALCVSGLCECPPDLPDECATACTNLQRDAANCGTCGNACLVEGELCTSGACQCPPLLPDTCPATGVAASCVNKGNDPKNCGTCGNVCATGASCSSGTCGCPAGEAICNDTCVPCSAGAACCPSGACQTKHSNGLGQSYFDCNPLYAANQTTAAAATAAANAWQPGTPTPPACDPVSCISQRTASQCAVWCFAGSNFAGRVELDSTSPVCVCPNSLSKSWN